MANKQTRILCVCQMGETRSAATRRRLNRRGYGNVVAIGVDKMAPEALQMLCEWAQIILVAEPKYHEFVPADYRSKIEQTFILGTDVWGNPRNPELQALVKEHLNRLGLR